MTGTSPRVSVVIPAHGHPTLLDDAISSVIAQDGADIIGRLIVVNDGCRYRQTRTGLAAWQARLGQRLLVLHLDNQGLSAARNSGIDAALAVDPDHEAIFLLDADNVLADGAAQLFGRLLDANPDADWFYPDFDFFGQDGYYITDHQPSLLFHARLNISEAGSLIRRRVFEAGLRFDTTMRRGYEDWDFWLGAAREGFRGHPAAQPMLHYRKRPASMLANSHDEDTELRRFIEQKHRWLFNVPTLLAEEARSFPRYVLFDGEENITLCTDPAHQEPVTLEALEKKLWAHLCDPFTHHAPSYLIVMRDGLRASLDKAGLLRNVLWLFERRLARAGETLPGYDLLYLDQSPEGHQIDTAIKVPDRPADAAAIPLSVLARILRERNTGWIRQIDHIPEPHGASAWSLRLDGVVPPDADIVAGATEILRDTLLRLVRSPYRPALAHSWQWRDQGGAVSRAEAVDIARQVAGSGVVFPLLKNRDTRDIGFVLPIFDFGGVEKVAASMARVFRDKGYRCHLFVTGNRPIRSDDWALAAFSSINWFPDASTTDWSGPEFMGTAEPSWGNPTERADLMGLLSGMDVVINAHSAALHKIAGRLRKRGVIMVGHEHVVERSTYGRAYGPPVLALAYEHSYDLFLTCSQALRLWLQTRGMPREKILPVINAPGYPMDGRERDGVLAARAARSPSEPLRVLYLGRLDPQKGVQRLAAIYETLHRHDPRMELRVVGQTVVQARAQQVAFPPGTRLDPAVRGPGALTRILAEADIMILPSHYEGLPLSVLEAQRCGVTVIAADAGAMDEAIEDGQTGFIVPQDGCVEAAVARVLELDRDRALLARIGRAAAARVREWSETTSPLLDWVEATLESRAAKATPRHKAG
ncbi:glycosyltransferase [Halodurantibacterium flavum]|uniref:Glycosyltransferase n=1 Tax=Halodurantibacterium flavum TaxID=1382802 RepID=A0ABW4S178_9RHOB